MREKDPGQKDTVLSRLRRAGLEPRKGLGQHFLHDPRILGEIAAAGDLGPADAVLEVGTGAGTLTRELAARSGRVLTVEVDPELLEFAREELRGCEGIRFLRSDALDGKGGLSDALRSELMTLGPFKLVSNLPYSIATPLILELLSSGLPMKLAVVTLQKELALRLGASPGTREYGPASAMVAFWAVVERVRSLPPGAFWPPPKVSSAVIRIVPRPVPLGEITLYAAYREWVHRLLSQRRKQVGGLLRHFLGEKIASEAIQRLRLNPSERPEKIQPEGFVLLSREFAGFGFDSLQEIH